MDKHGAVFVRIDDYKDVIEIMSLVRNKLEEAKHTINEINVLKNKEDGEIDLWTNELEDVERKLEYVDKTLFEPENV